MPNDLRITNHNEVAVVAGADRSGEGVCMVKVTLIELWQMVHRVPVPSGAEGERIRGLRTD